MTNYSTNTNTNTSTSCCFTAIFKRFNCTGNLPTYPSLPDNQSSLEKPVKFHSSANAAESINNVVKSRVQSHVIQTQAQGNSPGIIARLMGLETLPNYEKFTTLDSLFRSKSLNSLHFLPDFDPTTAAFHRRARTSASFHEQGHKFLIKTDENLENDCLLVKDSENGYYECIRQRKREREKEVALMEKSRQSGSSIRSSRTKVSGSKKKYEESYGNGASSSCSRRSRSLKNSVNSSNLREKCAMQKRKFVNNKEIKVSSTVTSKKKVGHSQVMCIEAHQIEDNLLSRNPVSVLDDHKEVTSASSKGNGRQISSSSRRKSTPKIKIYDNLPQDIVPKSKQNYEDRCSSRIASKHELLKAEGKVADYFVEMLGYICKLAKEHTRETNWVPNYELVKVHFVEELSLHLGQEILYLLLDELLHDITIFFL